MVATAQTRMSGSDGDGGFIRMRSACLNLDLRIMGNPAADGDGLDAADAQQPERSPRYRATCIVLMASWSRRRRGVADRRAEPHCESRLAPSRRFTGDAPRSAQAIAGRCTRPRLKGPLRPGGARYLTFCSSELDEFADYTAFHGIVLNTHGGLVTGEHAWDEIEGSPGRPMWGRIPEG